MIVSKDHVLCGLLVCAAFGIVYLLSLSFVYVEGDDAHIVAYHALGRSELQPRYSRYHSMMDAALSVLPPRESVVRIAGMSLTAICAPALFLLIMFLVFDWCRGMPYGQKVTVVAVMLASLPEFYYLGMVLTPAIVAMSFLVAAHLLLRRSAHWSRRGRWLGFVTSVALFGMGAAFRWDTIVYGATIVADLVFRGQADSDERLWTRIRVALLWGLAAGIAWLAAITLSGENLADTFKTIRAAGPVEPLDLMSSLSRIQTFFTPAFAALFIAGACILLHQRHPLAAIAAVSVVVLGKLTLYGTPKWMITAFPTLMAVACAGMCVLWHRPRYRHALIGLVVLPWIFGVHMVIGGTAWGPGFEIQPFDRVAVKSSWPWVSAGAGFAIPSPEGPRPVFGHAWALGGDWRRFVNEYWLEHRRAVSTAIEANVPVLLHDGDRGGMGVVAYLQLGFTTDDSFVRVVPDNLIERRWRRLDGSDSRMFSFVETASLFDPDAVGTLRRASGDTVVIIAFTSTLAGLFLRAPDSLHALGKATAVLRLDQLEKRLRDAQPLPAGRSDVSASEHGKR